MKRWRRRKTFCAAEGAHFLSPFDDEDVIEGQASVAVEIEEQLGRVPDHIILPVGGGGLSRGYLQLFREIAAIHVCRTEGAPSLCRALAEGSAG